MKAGAASWQIPALLLLAFLLRVLWPLADPALYLSWSNGTYTDPASITHAARNAVLFGEWVRDGSRDLVFYPLLNGITWVAYQGFGVSRLVTQILSALLGTVAVAGIAWTVHRARGSATAVTACVLAGAAFWIVMFSRVPLAENLVVAILALACAAAVGRGTAAGLTAGALTGVVALFGKIHGLAFLPALLVFVVWRGRGVRHAVPALLGFAAVAAVWVAFVFLPHRAEILGQVSAADELYGSLPVLRSPGAMISDLVWTMRSAWMFHRIPVLGAVGGLFLVTTFATPEARRRRLDDGTALFALWIVAAWLFLATLPYKAPRYFVLVAVPLAAAAGCGIREIARGELRPGRAATVIWIFLTSFVAWDALAHAFRSLDNLVAPSLSPTADSLRALSQAGLDFLFSPATHVLLTAALAAPLTWLYLRPPAALSRRLRAVAAPRQAALLVGAFVAVQAVQFAVWATHRMYAIEQTKESLDGAVGEDAVLVGQFAPLLVQDTRRVGVPLFGALTADLLRAEGATHVLFASRDAAAALRQKEPDLVASLAFVRQWPFRSRNLRALQLYRLPGAAYQPTAFERGVDALSAEDDAKALEEFAEHRRTARRPLPDVLSLEAMCWFNLGEVDRARARLEEAVALRPTSPEDWLNLGSIRLNSGDPAGARQAWERSLALDPWDSGAAASLRALENGPAPGAR